MGADSPYALLSAAGLRSRLVRVATSARGVCVLGDRGVRVIGESKQRDVRVLWRRSDMSSGDLDEALSKLPDLNWLHTDTAGVDDLPLTELAARDVVVTRTDAYTRSVAEWVLGAVMLAAKGLPDYVRASDRGEWSPGIGRARLVDGARAVIIGHGAIGQTAEDLLASIGVAVAHAPRRAVDWPSILAGCDYLIVALPLTRQTAGYVGAEVLAALPQGAWLINVGRGGVVDERALADAVVSARLGGAVIDVWQTEPLPATHWAWQRPEVLVLPHDCWRAQGAGQRQVSCFLRQLDRYAIHGRDALELRVDLTAGY